MEIWDHIMPLPGITLSGWYSTNDWEAVQSTPVRQACTLKALLQA